MVTSMSLVQSLSNRGISTLPSCAGHFPSDDDLWALYQNLMKDAEWVRSYGLTLKCVETGELDVHRDPSWRLPYYETWAAETKKYSGIGRLGMVLPQNIVPQFQANLADMSGVRVEVKPTDDGGPNRIVTIITQTKNLEHRDNTWGTITHRLK